MSEWHREYYRRKARARIIAMGGPWPCDWCRQGEVWKAYAKYCCRDCYYAANRAMQKARDARRVKKTKAEPVRPARPVFQRATSLADCG